MVGPHRRWVVVPPDKWDRVSQNKATKTPMAEWIKQELTAYQLFHKNARNDEQLFWEFIQEPGEVVFIPVSLTSASAV